MAAKTRTIPIFFRVNQKEREIIEQKMKEIGTTNMGAYLRKMAIDGYAIRVEAPEFKELLRLLGIAGNNLNQLTRRVRATGKVYDADLESLDRDFSQLLAESRKMLEILERLDNIRK